MGRALVLLCRARCAAPGERNATVPPVINGMPDADCSLWPPNRKLREVARISAADADSGVAPGSLTVTVASSEPHGLPHERS
jgi:hypothetical protein